MHDQNLGAKFSGGGAFCIFYISSSYVSFIEEKNVKFYYCHSIERCMLVERILESEKNATYPSPVGHICQEK